MEEPYGRALWEEPMGGAYGRALWEHPMGAPCFIVLIGCRSLQWRPGVFWSAATVTPLGNGKLTERFKTVTRLVMSRYHWVSL